MLMPRWYQYVVECGDGSFYAGSTTDIQRRLFEHNNTNKGAKYTKSRRPVKLVYSQEFENRSKAQKAEAAFKKLSRSEKERVVYGDDDENR